MQDEVVDPVSQKVIQPAAAEVMILPVGEGNHIHVIEKLIIKEDDKPSRKSDEDTIKECRVLFKVARDYESEFRRDAEESHEFYKGNQWSAAQKNQLEKKQRAAITINEIEPKIDVMSGTQRQNRTDIKYLPVDGGDQFGADVLNQISKNIAERSDFDHHETLVFEDGLNGGRGLFNITIDNEKDLEGQIVIKKYIWDDVYFGPHDEYDLSDCEYLTKTKWYSLGKLKSIFPDKADELQTSFDLDQDSKGFFHNVRKGLQYVLSDNVLETTATTDPELVDIAKKEYRLLEYQRKEYKKVPVVFNFKDNFYESLDGVDKKQVDRIMTINGLEKIMRSITKVRIDLMAGSVKLETQMSLIDEFDIVVYYAKKKGKYVWGKVQGMKEIQREINKRHSQSIDIVTKASSYGFYIDEGMFTSPQDEQRFKDSATSPGFVVKVADVNRIPKEASGTRFPHEMVALEERSSFKMKEISNINPEILGQQGRAESGIAIVEKRRQALTGNEFLFDNLSFAKRQLGRIQLKLIQEHYTPARILRLLVNQNERQEFKINGVPFIEYETEFLEDLLNKLDLSKYDVVVGESASSPTKRQGNFVIWSSMATKGLPVTPELLMELSDLSPLEKQKWTAAMEQQRALEKEIQDSKQSTEIRKTLIANQSQENI